jgi:hypothetical protein
MAKEEAMVSRSLRIKRETLEVLQREADKNDLGITVYIRTVLESLVEQLQENEIISEVAREFTN